MNELTSVNIDSSLSQIGRIKELFKHA